MKCIVCDRCKKIIDNPRNFRVITCAKPLKLPTENCKVPYHGNDKQQNDILWEKDICLECLDVLETFFDTESEQPDNTSGGAVESSSNTVES